MLSLLFGLFYFNPPSPCGEGHLFDAYDTFASVFQSTLPMRGGTFSLVRCKQAQDISIHPPHAGRDTC